MSVKLPEKREYSGSRTIPRRKSIPEVSECSNIPSHSCLLKSGNSENGNRREGTEEEKEKILLEFDADGIAKGVDWLNEQFVSQAGRWKAVSRR